VTPPPVVPKGSAVAAREVAPGETDAARAV
jgi:hypothetical protein